MADDVVLRCVLLDPLQVGALNTIGSESSAGRSGRPDGEEQSPQPPVLAPIIDESINLSDLILRLWRGKWLILAVTLLGTIAGVMVARGRPVQYTATLQVTPAVNSPRSGGGSALGGFASLAGITGSSTATSFDLYATSLTSRAVANELARDPRIMHTIFANEWDAAKSVWHPVSDRLAGLRSVLGLPRVEWRAPDGARLQDYVERAIKVGRATGTSPITTVSFTDPDPAFAAALLNRLNDAADRKVRQEDLARARSYIGYLQIKLALVTQAEQRTAIVGILSDQERSAMTASNGLSYAAQVIEPAPVPRVPSSTSPFVIMAGSAVGGMLVGSLLSLVDWRQLRMRLRQN